MTSYFIFYAYFYDYLLTRHEIASVVACVCKISKIISIFLEFCVHTVNI